MSVQRVRLLPLRIVVAWFLDLRHDSGLLVSLKLPLLSHAYPKSSTLISLAVDITSPLACLLFKNRRLPDMQVQVVLMSSMLPAGSVHHLQPRRRRLQATLLHHCIRLLPVHYVPAARLTFPAFHQCPIQHLYPGVLNYCHRHVHTQRYALDCSNQNSVDDNPHFPRYAKDNALYTYCDCMSI